MKNFLDIGNKHLMYDDKDIFGKSLAAAPK
jgi:hypothetical protein